MGTIRSTPKVPVGPWPVAHGWYMLGSMSMDAYLRQELRAIRKRKRLSQEEVGGRAGIDRTWISKIERGRANWTKEHLPALAAGCGVEEHELFGYPTPPPRLLKPAAREILAIVQDLDAEGLDMVLTQAQLALKMGHGKAKLEE